MLSLLRGYEKGPINVMPEATAIELLGVWPCRVESSRLDGRRLRTSALDYVKCVVLAGVVLVGALSGCFAIHGGEPIRPSGMHGRRAYGGAARGTRCRRNGLPIRPQMKRAGCVMQLRDRCDGRPRAEAPAIHGRVHIGRLAPAASRLMAMGLVETA